MFEPEGRALHRGPLATHAPHDPGLLVVGGEREGDVEGQVALRLLPGGRHLAAHPCIASVEPELVAGRHQKRLAEDLAGQTRGLVAAGHAALHVEALVHEDDVGLPW